MATAGTLEYLISIDNSKVQSGLSKAESKVKGFGDKLSAWTVAKGQMIGRLVERAGASTLNFVKGSIQESRQFDASMSQVAATLGKTVAQMNDEVKSTSVNFGSVTKEFTGNLTEFARFMGQNTKYTASEAADALNYMALAGYDTEKSMRMLPTVLNLASAGNFELARASDMVTDAQSALGLSIEQTETLVDQMAKTSSKTNTSVEQLGDAMLTIGGTAKMLGSGAIDTTTELSMALGVLADNGIKGSEGGTALRNVLLSLTAPTDKAAKKLKKLGIDVFDSQGNMKDLPFILQDINEATKDMTSEERTDFLSEVFNKRDLKAIEALLGTDMSRWEELFTQIGNSNGAAAEMAETQLDNLEGDVTKLKSALSEAKLTIADKLTPTLRTLTQKGIVWVTRLTDAFNQNGFGGAIKEAGTLLKETAAEYLGLGTDSTWTDLGIAAAKKLKNGIKKAFNKAKVKIADFLGIEDSENASWSSIAKGIKDKIKSKLKGAKIKIADLLGVDDPNNATWGDIARKIGERIKGKINNAKIKIADFLEVEDAENATWGDIAGKIVERIKAKFNEAKIKIADMLGIEDAENATWGDIAGNITERIKGKLKEGKIKIADLLGIEDAEDATWGDIGGKIVERLKAKIGEGKMKIADLLGIEEPGDATWSDIGSNIKERLKSAMSTLKLKAADLLGIEDAGNATWADIGKKITSGLSTAFKDGKTFVLKMLLGEGLDESEYTFINAGKKIAGWFTEAMGEGGFFDTLLKGWTEKGTAIAVFAGEVISGIANWVSSHSSEVSSLVKSIMDAITAALPSVIDALKTILTNKDFQDAFAQLLKSGFEASMELLGTLFESLGDMLGRAIYGEEWYNMKEKGKQTVREKTGSYQEGNDEWNKKAREIDKKYNMDVTATYDSTGSSTDPMTATMMHIGLKGGIPRWWSEYQQLENLVNLRKTASESGSDYLYEASTAGIRAFGDAWKEGLRSEELSAKVNEAFNSITPPEVEPEIKMGESEATKIQSYLNGLGLTVPVTITYNDPESGGAVSHSFAKGEWDVPHDMYAKLHRNETVLNATQARQYREGKTGGDTSEIVGALQSLRNDLSNLQLVVGRKTFGRAVVNYGGSRMSDYIGGSDSRLAAGYGT